jgi:hypothetical protein
MASCRGKWAVGSASAAVARPAAFYLRNFESNGEVLPRRM